MQSIVFTNGTAPLQQESEPHTPPFPTLASNGHASSISKSPRPPSSPWMADCPTPSPRPTPSFLTSSASSLPQPIERPSTVSPPSDQHTTAYSPTAEGRPSSPPPQIWKDNVTLSSPPTDSNEEESVLSHPSTTANDQSSVVSASSSISEPISAAEYRLQESLGSTGLNTESLALESVIKEIEDEEVEEIVLPRSPPMPRNHADRHPQCQNNYQHQRQREVPSEDEAYQQPHFTLTSASSVNNMSSSASNRPISSIHRRHSSANIRPEAIPSLRRVRSAEGMRMKSMTDDTIPERSNHEGDDNSHDDEGHDIDEPIHESEDDYDDVARATLDARRWKMEEAKRMRKLEDQLRMQLQLPQAVEEEKKRQKRIAKEEKERKEHEERLEIEREREWLEQHRERKQLEREQERVAQERESEMERERELQRRLEKDRKKREEAAERQRAERERDMEVKQRRRKKEEQERLERLERFKRQQEEGQRLLEQRGKRMLQKEAQEAGFLRKLMEREIRRWAREERKRQDSGFDSAWMNSASSIFPFSLSSGPPRSSPECATSVPCHTDRSGVAPPSPAWASWGRVPAPGPNQEQPGFHPSSSAGSSTGLRCAWSTGTWSPNPPRPATTRIRAGSMGSTSFTAPSSGSGNAPQSEADCAQRHAEQVHQQQERLWQEQEGAILTKNEAAKCFEKNDASKDVSEKAGLEEERGVQGSQLGRENTAGSSPRKKPPLNEEDDGQLCQDQETQPRSEALSRAISNGDELQQKRRREKEKERKARRKEKKEREERSGTEIQTILLASKTTKNRKATLKSHLDETISGFVQRSTLWFKKSVSTNKEDDEEHLQNASENTRRSLDALDCPPSTLGGDAVERATRVGRKPKGEDQNIAEYDEHWEGGGGGVGPPYDQVPERREEHQAMERRWGREEGLRWIVQEKDPEGQAEEDHRSEGATRRVGMKFISNEFGFNPPISVGGSALFTNAHNFVIHNPTFICTDVCTVL